MRNFKQYLNEGLRDRAGGMKEPAFYFYAEEFSKRCEQDPSWMEGIDEPILVKGSSTCQVNGPLHWPKNLTFDVPLIVNNGKGETFTGTFLKGVELNECAYKKIENLKVWPPRPNSYALRVSFCDYLEDIDASVWGSAYVNYCDQIDNISNLKILESSGSQGGLRITGTFIYRFTGNFPGPVHLTDMSNLEIIEDVVIKGMDPEGISLKVIKCPGLESVKNVKCEGQISGDEKFNRTYAKEITGHTTDNTFADLFDL